MQELELDKINTGSPLSSALAIYSFIQNKSLTFPTPIECEEFFSSIFNLVDTTMLDLKSSIFNYDSFTNLSYIWFLFSKLSPMYDISSVSLAKEKSENKIFSSNLCSEIVIPSPYDSVRCEVLRCFIRAAISHVNKSNDEMLKSCNQSFFENYFPQYLTHQLEQNKKSEDSKKTGHLSSLYYVYVKPIIQIVKLSCLIDVLNENEIKVKNYQNLNLLFALDSNPSEMLEPFNTYVKTQCPDINLDDLNKTNQLHFLRNLRFSIIISSNFQSIEKFILNNSLIDGLENLKSINQKIKL